MLSLLEMVVIYSYTCGAIHLCSISQTREHLLSPCIAQCITQQPLPDVTLLRIALKHMHPQD